ncbi:PilW family protein [Endozoicomonas sp. SCSIO W0465]|uniref:PilW family protein n=1 Tax=Endozoicomonas sp. SCSIO W0465 TaxID=2918516 RepID=UPI0020761BB4|nr:PilW family protein [Endozoicomonas sp. SCSIO W0465]USE37535.1 PilW family protein [Endozoicomonas sp. SCSIO W0465]
MSGTDIINHQKGFSIIEMMLAFIMGLIVAGSALQLMVSNSRSANVNEFIATAQENGRHSLYIMSTEFRKAGFRSGSGVSPIQPFYRGRCEGDTICTVDGGGTDSDRIAIQYEPMPDPNSGQIEDCTGAVVTAGALTADVYFVDQDSANNNISTLFCRGYDPLTGTPRGSAQAVVQGVERLQVVYGTAPAGTKMINQYVTASAVADWRQVLGIRVGVLVSAGEPSRVFDQRTRTYNLLNSGNMPLNDQTPRYMYSTAIRLNNTGL